MYSRQLVCGILHKRVQRYPRGSAQNLSAPEIRKRIQATATDLGAPGKDAFFGHGLVNAEAAVANDTAVLSSVSQGSITPTKK
jgi:hypothetical protein